MANHLRGLPMRQSTYSKAVKMVSLAADVMKKNRVEHLVCRHCAKNWGRRRGLCSPCYEVFRDLYPVRPNPTILSPARPAQAATQAQPGSEEKIRVLCERYKNQEELWHPDDNRLPLVRFHGHDSEGAPRPLPRHLWAPLQPDRPGFD